MSKRKDLRYDGDIKYVRKEIRRDLTAAPQPKTDEELLSEYRDLQEKGDALLTSIDKKFDTLSELIFDQQKDLHLIIDPKKRPNLSDAISYFTKRKSKTVIDYDVYNRAYMTMRYAHLGALGFDPLMTTTSAERAAGARDIIDRANKFRKTNFVALAFKELLIEMEKWLYNKTKWIPLLKPLSDALKRDIRAREKARDSNTMSDWERNAGSIHGDGNTEDWDEDPYSEDYPYVGPTYGLDGPEPAYSMATLFDVPLISGAKTITDYVDEWAMGAVNSSSTIDMNQPDPLASKVNRRSFQFRKVYDLTKDTEYRLFKASVTLDGDVTQPPTRPVGDLPGAFSEEVLGEYTNAEWQRFKDNTVGFGKSFGWSSIKRTFIERVGADLDSILDDAINILLDWYKNPETFCCLIIALGGIGKIDLSLLYAILFMLKFVMMGLNIQLDSLLNSFIDFINALVRGVLGMLIEVMERAREFIIDRLMELFRDWKDDPNIRKCTPLYELAVLMVEYIDKAISDLLSYVEEYLSSVYLAHLKMNEFNIMEGRLQNLEFLYDLIWEILRALEAADLCADETQEIKFGTPSYIPTDTELERFLRDRMHYTPGEVARVTNTVDTIDGRVILTDAGISDDISAMLSDCSNPITDEVLRDVATIVERYNRE